MPFGPFILQWRTPSPNPPLPTPLPLGLSRATVHTSSGPLELLFALPPDGKANKPPLFFAHGGFGCASVWMSYMTYFSAHGYPCYAISYRGHGGSWYPGFWALYFTSRRAIGEDLVAGIKEVESLEMKRRNVQERVKVVLVSHSAGGALSQFVLSRGLVSVQGFCMLAAVPGFGSWSCYKFWFLSAPMNFYYRLFHSRYLLATTKQVHDAFFTPSTPTSVVQELERLLSPYESMLWPMQALAPFVLGPDVVSRITGWQAREGKTGSQTGINPRFLVLAAEHDVLCTPPLLEDAAKRYRAAFHYCLRVGKLAGVSEYDAREEESELAGEERDGVAFAVVKGLGHHLQNHVEWKRGADVLLRWTEQL